MTEQGLFCADVPAERATHIVGLQVVFHFEQRDAARPAVAPYLRWISDGRAGPPDPPPTKLIHYRVAGVLDSEISLWAHVFPPPDAVLPSQFIFAHNMNGSESMPLGFFAEGGEYVCESSQNGEWLIRNTRHKGDMPAPTPQLVGGSERP